MMARGPIELVERFLSEKRQSVNDKIQSEPVTEETNDVKEVTLRRLQRIMELHFEYIDKSGLKSTWPSAIALLIASPTNLPHSLSALNDIVGDLSDAADLRPTRLDWYGERALLASLFVSAEMFFLTDDSEGLVETR